MTGKPYVAFVCLAGMLAVVGCKKAAAEKDPVRPVRAFKVGDVKALQGREFPGKAQARDEVDLSFRVSGPLIALPVDVGTKVQKGNVIASIDPRDFKAALDSAQGSLSVAEANLLAMERGARPEESNNSRRPSTRPRPRIAKRMPSTNATPRCCSRKRSPRPISI